MGVRNLLIVCVRVSSSRTTAAMNEAALVGAAEDEEGELVVEHDHVAVDGVHEAAHGEDGVVAGVGEAVEALDGAAEER
ncbi:hypothetical protein ACLOJK_035521 [Asimina triloba]